MEPLGHDLCAYQDVYFQVLHPPDERQRIRRFMHSIARHDFEPQVGELGAGFFGQAFDAWPAGRETALGLTGWAGQRWRRAVAAVMTLQPVEQPVFDQPCRTLRAVEPMPAGAAQGQRRVSAPVQKQHRLFPRGDRLGHRTRQGG